MVIQTSVTKPLCIMKTFKLFALLSMVAFFNSCTSELETDITSANLTTQLEKTSDFEQPVVFLEELYYRHLVITQGEQADETLEYNEYLNYLGALPKCGPRPKPCGNEGGLLGNCKMLIYEDINSFRTFSIDESIQIDVFDYQGEYVNTIAGFESIKCPKKAVIDSYLENPLEGCGYMNVSFYSEVSDSVLEFTIDYAQLESGCY